MQVDIKINKKEKTARCTITLEEATPIYKHRNSGRILNYENFEYVKTFNVKQLVSKELGATATVGTCLEGPQKLHNKDRDNRTATWVFEIDSIKSLTSPLISDNVNAGTKIKKQTRKSKSKK